MIRIFFGVLIYFAIFFQLYYLHNDPNYNLINYVSYFTVLSNFFAASVLIFTGIKTGGSKDHDTARGASTLYILITGLGFIFLLGGDNDQLLPWVNIILHYIAPIVMLLDWIIEPLNEKISLGEATAWIAPPIVYLGFALIRGQLINWYPYEFLNPNITSQFEMVIYLLSVTAGMVFLIFGLTKIARVKS